MDENVLDVSVAERCWEASAVAFMECYSQVLEPQVHSGDLPMIPQELQLGAKKRSGAQSCGITLPSRHIL